MSKRENKAAAAEFRELAGMDFDSAPAADGGGRQALPGMNPALLCAH